MELFIEIIGWVGALLVITAYFLVSYRKVDSKNKIYQWMNFFGALGVGISVFYTKSWPALAIQVVWALIAIFALAKIYREKELV